MDIKYDIIVVTAFYKRENVFKMFLDGLKKNQEDIKLHAILVGSCSIKNEKELVESYGFDYVYAPNEVLSKKWNKGIEKLKIYDYDYCMILGSDDVISNNLLKRLHTEMDGYDFGGLLDMYIYDLNEKKTYKWTGFKKNNRRYGEPIGAGRMFAKPFVERLNHRLWTRKKNYALDHNSYGILKKLNPKIYTTKLQDGEYMVDIKGGNVQIWNMKKWKKLYPNTLIECKPIIL